MTELSYLTPGVKGFKDRSGMLLVVGILFIIAGALCGCMTAMIPLALFVPQPAGVAAQQQQQQRPIDVVVGLLVYAGLCAGLLTLGIGCVRKRRWVRPLVIVFGWIGLFAGALGMIMWGVAAPDMASAMRAATPPGAAAPPPAFFNVMVAIMTVIMVVIYLIIPATLLWLFRGKDVQATLEHYDPAVRWTDAVPVPVLGLCVLLALGALWALLTAVQGWFLAFGVILTGAAARVTSMMVAAAFAAAAWLSFRLRPAGWWLAVALFAVLPIAFAITLLRHGTVAIYRAMGMGDAELRVIESIRLMGPTLMSISLAALAIGTIAFALYVRKYFRPGSDQEARPDQPPPLLR